MKIISFSDIHGHFSVFKKFKNIFKDCDVMILSGDITDFGTAEDVKKCLKEIRKYFDKELYAVIGNCDYPSVEDELDKEGINIHGKVVEYKNFIFAGLGGSLVTPFSTPVEYTEEDYKVLLEQMDLEINTGRPLIFISHQPPFDSGCDRLSNGTAIGSKEVRNFIERNDPAVCFTGHIHESCGKGMIGKTPVINPGQAKKGSVGIFESNEKGSFKVYLQTINKLF